MIRDLVFAPVITITAAAINRAVLLSSALIFGAVLYCIGREVWRAWKSYRWSVGYLQEQNNHDAVVIQSFGWRWKVRRPHA